MSKKFFLLKRRIKRSMENIKGQRLIEGFYYAYIAEPKEIGDRTKGWLICSTDIK